MRSYNLKNGLASLVLGASMLGGLNAKAQGIIDPEPRTTPETFYVDVKENDNFQGMLDQAIDGDTYILRNAGQIFLEGNYNVSNDVTIRGEFADSVGINGSLKILDGTTTANWLKMNGGNTSHALIETFGSANLTAFSNSYTKAQNSILHNSTGNLIVRTSDFAEAENTGANSISVNQDAGYVEISRNTLGYANKAIDIFAPEPTFELQAFSSISSDVAFDTPSLALKPVEIQDAEQSLSGFYIVNNDVRNSTGYGIFTHNSINADVTVANNMFDNLEIGLADTDYFVNLDLLANNFNGNGEDIEQGVFSPLVALASDGVFPIDENPSGILDNYSFDPGYLSDSGSEILNPSLVKGKGVYIEGVTTWFKEGETFIGSNGFSNAIPEPSSGLLLLLGASALTYTSRKK